jgi:aminodeoxyfutalosine deaminase
MTLRVRLGVQPHAPYSVSRAAYRAAGNLAARHGLGLSTHLAETEEECEFVARGVGPRADLLRELGIWQEGLDVGHGQSPVRHLGGVLDGRFVAAHVNLADDDDLDVLRARGVVVAYCPRASASFVQAATPPRHRYRDMLARGIPVALGTDSVVGLPRADLSILEEMRHLYRRDGTDGRTLLRMATVHGARALGWDSASFTLGAGSRPAGVVSVPITRGGEGLEAALVSDSDPRLELLGEPVWATGLHR